MGLDTIPTPLTPEEQEIANGIRFLSEEGSINAIKNLCFGQGGVRGSFSTKGITFRLLGLPGASEELEKIQLQLEPDGADKIYRWQGSENGRSADADMIAKELAAYGVTPEQMESFIGHVRDAL
jgi:hypothetical protein